MEITMTSSIKEKLKNLAFKEKSYFLNRREINWGALVKCGAFALCLSLVGILLIPAPQEPVGDFHEKSDFSENNREIEVSPTHETANYFESGFSRSVPSSLNHLYAPTYGGASGTVGDEQNSSMILARDGLDSKTQIPPGSKLSIRLYEKTIVAGQGMPVIGVVTHDYVHEGIVAIPQSSKLFGDISFDEGGERAKIEWRSVQLPDGRERSLSAIGVGVDGQPGVSGRVHSDALKNAVGQTLTRFIGAYAEGSMQRGALGGSPGGRDNGLKNAIAETARDGAETWANDLKKEKRWIEISNGTEFYAILTANFAFRDPGATYDR